MYKTPPPPPPKKNDFFCQSIIHIKNTTLQSIQKVKMDDLQKILEDNYNSWKEKVIEGHFLFLFEPHNKDILLLFVDRLLSERAISVSTYKHLLSCACSFLRHDIIKIFLKHPLGIRDDTGVMMGVRRCACFYILTSSTMESDKYYIFGKGPETVLMCMPLLLDIEDPSQVLFYNKDNVFNNLLFIAIEYCHLPEVYSFLIDRGFDPNTPYKLSSYNNHSITYQTTAIDLARKRGTPEAKAFFENYTKKNSDLFTLLFNLLS